MSKDKLIKNYSYNDHDFDNTDSTRLLCIMVKDSIQGYTNGLIVLTDR